MELRVTDLAVARAGVPVLEGVSFALPPGQVLVLRGPNGVGKTSLLRVVAGLQPAMAGKIERDADDIAYAAHADGVKAGLTVRENLQFWAEIFGTRLASAAMAAFDLTALADRRAAHLSAGQKRRLGLARLLVCGRALWLLDEPTVSLDDASVQRFAAVVAGHLAAGGSALIATHSGLGLAAQELDLTRYRSRAPGLGGRAGAFDEAIT